MTARLARVGRPFVKRDTRQSPLIFWASSKKTMKSLTDRSGRRTETEWEPSTKAFVFSARRKTFFNDVFHLQVGFGLEQPWNSNHNALLVEEKITPLVWPRKPKILLLDTVRYRRCFSTHKRPPPGIRCDLKQEDKRNPKQISFFFFFFFSFERTATFILIWFFLRRHRVGADEHELSSSPNQQSRSITTTRPPSPGRPPRLPQPAALSTPTVPGRLGLFLGGGLIDFFLHHSGFSPGAPLPCYRPALPRTIVCISHLWPRGSAPFRSWNSSGAAASVLTKETTFACDGCRRLVGGGKSNYSNLIRVMEWDPRPLRPTQLASFSVAIHHCWVE